MIRTGRLLDMSLSERIFFERASRRRQKSNYEKKSSSCDGPVEIPPKR